MNVKEYISSGVIESCVLGLASDQECAAFNLMCATHPEIAAARDAFESSLEQLALQNAATPPATLKGQIWDQLSNAANTKSGRRETKTPVRALQIWKYAAAASLILLAAGAMWTYSLYNETKELANQNQQLKTDLNQYNERLAVLENDLQKLKKPGMKMAALKGTNISPQSFATIYWDTTSTDVYLMINNLPQHASNQQYQLWALLDGKPIDLGVFEMKKEKLLIQAKNVQRAEAFAITLEKKGGNPTPEGAIYVSGAPF